MEFAWTPRGSGPPELESGRVLVEWTLAKPGISREETGLIRPPFF